MKKRFKFANQHVKVAWNDANETDPAEVMVYDVIGCDPWSGQGMTAKDFKNILDSIPQSRDLNIRVNSKGGDVHEGLAMMHILNEWPGKVMATIDGIAASTASWMILGADEVRAPKSCQMFIHDAISFGFGNAEDFRKQAEDLDKMSNQIAEIYSDKTGKGVRTMREMMRNETLLTGEEAEELGLVDTLIEGRAMRNFSQQEILNMKERIAAIYNVAGTKGGNAQNKNEESMKKKLIAMLNKHGVKELNGVAISPDMTDEQLKAVNEEQLEAALNTLLNKLEQKPEQRPNGNAEVDELKKQIARLTEADNAARKLRITNEVDQLIKDDKLPAPQRESVINMALKDEACLQVFNAMPAQKPGAEPVGKVLEATASIQDIAVGFESHNRVIQSFQRGNDVSMVQIRDAAVSKANFFNKWKDRLIAVWNTNTIATELKRQVILQDVLRDFVRRLVPLGQFSTVFQNVPLQGLNTVEVPYYDLDTNASTSFQSGTGYTTIGNTTTDKREITVGEGASNGDRLYQALAFSSQEIARQPYLNIRQLLQLKVEKLAYDIFADVLGIVTAANYGAAAVTKPSDTFDSDDIANMKVACKTWPEMGRSLFLDSTYDGQLLKDPAFKYALNAASDSAIKEGRLYPRVMGFDYVENPNIPGNSENLVGFAVFKGAILVATAPVPPVEEIRQAGTIYELVTDPQTGISFEYRRFGNNVTDAATNVVECSYGFAKGVGTALKRIASA